MSVIKNRIFFSVPQGTAVPLLEDFHKNFTAFNFATGIKMKPL